MMGLWVLKWDLSRDMGGWHGVGCRRNRQPRHHNQFYTTRHFPLIDEVAPCSRWNG